MSEQAITAFNVDLACDLVCAKCEKFFDCESPHKRDDIFVERMAQARETMKDIKHKILVVGGKGGVVKTLLTANLATAFAMLGHSRPN